MCQSSASVSLKLCGGCAMDTPGLLHVPHIPVPGFCEMMRLYPQIPFGMLLLATGRGPLSDSSGTVQGLTT